MQYPLVLALFVLAICLFVAFYVVSKVLYRKRHETKYHFYQMFPYDSISLVYLRKISTATF